MIKVSLDDPNVVENFKAIQQLRETGDFTDKQLNEMYDRQVAADKSEEIPGGRKMKYRKKPVVIEAFQYDGDFKDSDGNFYVPEWAQKAFEGGIIRFGSLNCIDPPYDLFIDTLEGTHRASVGDYIIQGVNGEIYPCKPDIFEKTYEVAE